MKRTYPIREWKAIEQFRSHLSNDPGTIQMVHSLAEIAQVLRQGVSQLLHEAEKRLLPIIMDDEVAWLTAPGSVPGDERGHVDAKQCVATLRFAESVNLIPLFLAGVLLFFRPWVAGGAEGPARVRCIQPAQMPVKKPEAAFPIDIL